MRSKFITFTRYHSQRRVIPAFFFPVSDHFIHRRSPVMLLNDVRDCVAACAIRLFEA